MAELAVAALVLGAGALAKLADPAPTGVMLRSLGLRRAGGFGARAIGCVEACLAVVALAFGGRLAAAAVACAFAVFAFVAVVLLRRSRRGDGVASCGCFGSRSAPPSLLHVGVNVVCAAAALAAAVRPRPGLAALAMRGELHVTPVAVVGAGLVMLAAWLLVAIMTVLADTLDAARRVPRSAPVRELSVEGTRR